MATPKRVTVSSKDQFENAISKYVGRVSVWRIAPRVCHDAEAEEFSIPIGIIDFCLLRRSDNLCYHLFDAARS